jgi:glycosyltransferase involved in cell wall biosynthesis
VTRLPVTVIVLTYDEELNLESCLGSISAQADQLFVVDSGSTDRTLQIADSHGAVTASHPFETHARQWDWALRNLPIRNEWILGLDADQRLTRELRDELDHLFNQESARLKGTDGFYVRRRQIFRGRWIRFGGYYPKYLLKLFRLSAVRLDWNDLLDHHFHVAGRVDRLRHDLIEQNRKEDDISFWIEKHNRYAALVAAEELARKRGERRELARSNPFGSPDERVVWLKRIWKRLPLYVRPFLYFGYRYFLRLGFLDGKEGLVFHFLHGLWFRLLVDIKRDEMEGAGKRA